uniref:NADH-ubiquinone oxidoreductase chain 4L n=1 Tax=Astralium haematragum TaxID=307057 RepID=A0A1I9SSS8_9VEST|nr:NADH dehydrogenase subunit 4L [Astralium haematragum]AOZ71798.1 NADH dehydrogenase subunit 4L [Astralium haematragum]
MVKVSYLYVVGTIGVLFSVLTLSLQYKHLLSALLSLEAMTLSLFVLLVCISSGFNFEGPMCLILITMGACEASLGLAILVSLIRTHGNDYVYSFNAQKC